MTLRGVDGSPAGTSSTLVAIGTNSYDVAQRWRRDCTNRNRLATYAVSVYDALAAGFAPVPWKSLNAADWLTKTPPVRFSDNATPTSRAASRICAMTSGEVLYTDAVIAPCSCTVVRKSSMD